MARPFRFTEDRDEHILKPTFFPTPNEFRNWLAQNHAKSEELVVGFYKKGAGRQSMTWPESVAEALCFGWIDGIRRSYDDDSYTIRFTPRRPTSTWSAINIKLVERLIAEKRMRAAGLKAFHARKAEKSAVYSYENRPQRFDPAMERIFKTNKQAWKYFEAQPPWYRRTCVYWVTSAKKEETRAKRLATLISDSVKGRWIGPMKRPSKSS